jgi:hypothetical protein
MTPLDEATAFQMRRLWFQPNLGNTLAVGSLTMTGADMETVLDTVDRRADEIIDPADPNRPALEQRRIDALVSLAIDSPHPTSEGVAPRRLKAHIFSDAVEGHFRQTSIARPAGNYPPTHQFYLVATHTAVSVTRPTLCDPTATRSRPPTVTLRITWLPCPKAASSCSTRDQVNEESGAAVVDTMLWPPVHALAVKATAATNTQSFAALGLPRQPGAV